MAEYAKKTVWHFDEIEEDEETARLMPGFEIQYIITDETTENNNETVFGHCVFPPNSQHFPHRHLAAAEVVYVISGRVVNGSVTEDGTISETECGPGMATFVPKRQIHWTRNPYDEPAEFVFAYYGAPSLEKSVYVDLTEEVPIENVEVSGVLVHDAKVDTNLAKYV
ncbi:cupin domain-containing protein [Microbacterium sp. E-13]|uniref:cupin domain-containing protein n=1 Tax=Microbacterium sp. E-13 TaxID=3404048 RepID=UPI003CE93BEF